MATSSAGDSIRVAVRIRPLIDRERGTKAIWTNKENSIYTTSGQNECYCFDHVYGMDHSTQEIYQEFVKPIVTGVMSGYHGTVFAYGQTSSGKTHTVTGDDGNPGIIYLAIAEMFEHVGQMHSKEFLFSVAYMEIYKEKVKDLLVDESKALPLNIREKSGEVFVENLSEHELNHPQGFIQKLQDGETRRHTAATKINARSSRSHAIYRIKVESKLSGDDAGAVTVACLNLVDLAGSEKWSQTGAGAERAKEAAAINKSLLYLTSLIHELSLGNKLHISFRNSSLTRLLQNSLGGNAKTAIICNVTPASECREQTKSTLQFAGRAKMVTNKPVRNEILTDEAQLKRYKKEIDQLKQKLEEVRGGGSVQEEEDAATAATEAALCEEMSELPNARLVSTTIHQVTREGTTKTDDRHALFTMQFGQFLDHDITFTPESTEEGRLLECCEEEDMENPECLSIRIPDGDILLEEFPDGCLEFVRSQPTPEIACKYGQREQLNQLTAFIDGSNVYGSTFAVASFLREFTNGRLRTIANPANGNLKNILPLEGAVTDCIDEQGEGAQCYLGGDIRVSEQAALTSMHTIWTREHNRVADALADINPHWDDERVYQEGRRILGAMLQHIVLNEWLPEVLGPDLLHRFGLEVTPAGGFSREYDRYTNPGIGNGFAGAAFRFGHTLLPSGYDGADGSTNFVDLRDTFFRPASVNATLFEGVDPFLKALHTQRTERYDRCITDQVRDNLFLEPGQTLAMDLIARNFQRAREHGIPGYNRWREFCELPVIERFEELQPLLQTGDSAAVAELYDGLYNSPDDIDLFSIGIAESSVPGGIVGETFGCIIATQFRNLRRGDRFFYDLENQIGSFTLPQLTEIRKAMLSKVACTNSDREFNIQPWAMLLPGLNNGLTPCDRLPFVDLEVWRESPTAGLGLRFPQPPYRGFGVATNYH